MPTSFRVALAGVAMALIGAGFFAWVVLMVHGWEAIRYALFAMAVNGGGWLIALFGAGSCAARHPAWRKWAVGLIVLALGGLAFLAYVWRHA